jgi:hypothetical protein
MGATLMRRSASGNAKFFIENHMMVNDQNHSDPKVFVNLPEVIMFGRPD